MTLEPNCIFCKIIAGEIPANVILETPDALVFEDLTPQAPIHWLVIPKTHVASHLEVVDPLVFQHVMQAAQQALQQQGITSYRLVTNTGAMAGQSVFHWHVHVLAGRPLHWPPG
ncbi:MAG: HIT domain-containing protein [Vampirovibrionales bacterium]